MTEPTIASEPPQDPRQVVESFLHSVVVLDDVLEMSAVGEKRLAAVSVSEITSPSYPERLSATDDTDMSPDRGAPLNVDVVVNAFADMGLVCSVLNPAPFDDARESLGNPFPRRITKAAVRADIVVLDWKIRDSSGEITLDILRQILSDDCSSRRLRLIAIYTGEPNLCEIAESVKKTIQEFYMENELESEHLSRLSKGPIRIVTLAKEGTISSHSPSSGFSEVTEVQLANTLVEEFVSMTSGLLPNVALAGIGTIRNKAHSILERFTQELDPAYLGHRLLLPYPPDAEGHLVEALASEILSVLQEGRPGAQASIEAIGKRLRDTRQMKWRDILQYGLDDPSVVLPHKKDTHNCYGKKEIIKCGTGFFTDEREILDRRFAALLNLKSRYSQRMPRLTLGTILYEIGNDSRHYFLCLQPKCDSIRLTCASGFPMLPLRQVQPGKSCDIIVEREKDQWEDFKITTKPSKLFIPRFAPGRNPPGEVLAKGESGGFYFEDVGGVKYWWAAEMKDEHAFRFAGQVASVLARPGPNDAEWLRRRSG